MKIRWVFYFSLIGNKTNRKHHALNPWFSSGLLVSRNTKNKLATKQISEPSTENKNKYKIYNSIYNKLVRKAKINYFDLQFKSHFSNMKKTWATLNEVLGRHKKRVFLPEYFQKGETKITGTKNISEEFNNFFTGIGPTLAEKIPNSKTHFSSYLGEKVSHNFIFCKVTDNVLKEALKSMKSK